MMTNKRSAEKTVRDIRRAHRRHYSAEEKIRIVLEGLRGEDSIAELCRREGINSSVYYHWSKLFLEAGKKRLSGDTAREATSDDVKQLRTEASALKETLPGELQEHLQRFITYYNHERYHESLKNLTPADVYYGRGQEILDQRETIKINTLAMRRKMHYDNRNNLNLMS